MFYRKYETLKIIWNQDFKSLIGKSCLVGKVTFSSVTRMRMTEIFSVPFLVEGMRQEC